MSVCGQSNSKILQVITGLGVGGAERLCIELSDHIQQQGRGVSIIALNADQSLMRQYPHLRCLCVWLSLGRRDVVGLLRAAWRTSKLLTDQGIEVVHAHMFHALVFALILKFFKPSTRVVYTSHSFGGFTGVRKLCVRLSRPFRYADVLLAEKQHPELNAARTRLIPNGVRLRSTKQCSQEEPEIDSRCKFIFVGRLEAVKNPVRALEAFAKIAGAGASLDFVGDGPLRPELETRIAQLGLSESVRLLGRRDDVPSELQASDCLVISSDWEGLPMVALEAGAAGRAVVATAVGALPELLSGDCGWITEPDGLEAGLRSAMNSKAELKQRGMNLWSKVNSRYTINICAEKHLRLYAGEQSETPEA
jgi:glycosyltransferase involved in cell wall biosynthesis